MAVVTVTSNDGRFSRNDNVPAGLWTCKVCLCMVMTGNRTAHKAPCDLAHAPVKSAGFGV